MGRNGREFSQKIPETCADRATAHTSRLSGKQAEIQKTSSSSACFGKFPPL